MALANDGFYASEACTEDARRRVLGWMNEGCTVSAIARATGLDENNIAHLVGSGKKRAVRKMSAANHRAVMECSGVDDESWRRCDIQRAREALESLLESGRSLREVSRLTGMGCANLRRILGASGATAFVRASTLRRLQAAQQAPRDGGADIDHGHIPAARSIALVHALLSRGNKIDVICRESGLSRRTVSRLSRTGADGCHSVCANTESRLAEAARRLSGIRGDVPEGQGRWARCSR